MNLDFFKELENGAKKIDINGFIKELTNHLNNSKEKTNDKLDDFREENCLYQVVGLSSKGVYLQNKNNNKVFEEVNMSQELREKIGNDYILRYKNGEYIFEEELTDRFFEGLDDINEENK